MSMKYIINDSDVTVLPYGKPFTFSRATAMGRKVTGMCVNGPVDEQEMWDLLNPVVQIREFTAGRVALKGDTLYLDGKVMPAVLAKKFNQILDTGAPFRPFVAFVERLAKVTSKHILEQLFTFIDHLGFGITDDGCILGHKAVDRDYYSITGGSIEVLLGTVKDGHILNSIGSTIKVRRVDVCDDKNIGCSTGLNYGASSAAM